MRVKINGEALEVEVDAPGVPLAEVEAAAYRLHRRVCRGTRAAERADERRQEAGSLGPASAHQIIESERPRYGFTYLGEGEPVEVTAHAA